MKSQSPIFLGINLEMDPSIAIVKDGEVICYSEEERHIRIKHAKNIYPKNALKFCLDKANCEITDIDSIAINWDLTKYNNGYMEDFYKSIRKKYHVDEATISWQQRNLNKRNWSRYIEMHSKELKNIFGDIEIPLIEDFPHHYTHAFQSFMQSNFKEAICLTIDGSGDDHCTVIWVCKNQEIKPIKEIKMPHSLGWYYAAITEYLGFEAYDGEYKVMGLAAYGKENLDLREKIRKIIFKDEEKIAYEIDPTYIHYGEHNYSNRYTDKLVELFQREPRRGEEEIDNWHKSLAYEAQLQLEKIVLFLVKWAVKETGLSKVCIGGGVGLNVKLNSEIFNLEEVTDCFAHPLCSDAGASCGAALLASLKHTRSQPEKIRTLALGYENSSNDIQKFLDISKIKYEQVSEITKVVAEELNKGKIIGWVQGKMEAGPRALGQRSILANPTKIEYRDKVNEVIKFREDWRPFCPSMLEEYSDIYFKKKTLAPFMIIAFEASEKLRVDAPAIVHVDGTSRVQLVDKNVLPLYYNLIQEFKNLSGVPVILNTSFNLKGEPIVCTVKDALRTFYSSGMDILAIGDFIIRKEIA